MACIHHTQSLRYLALNTHTHTHTHTDGEYPLCVRHRGVGGWDIHPLWFINETLQSQREKKQKSGKKVGRGHTFETNKMKSSFWRTRRVFMYYWRAVMLDYLQQLEGGGGGSITLFRHVGTVWGVIECQKLLEEERQSTRERCKEHKLVPFH